VPFAVVQLTDPHIGAEWSTRAASSLGAVVAAVGDLLGRTPDAVIVTGDIAGTPTDDEYAEAAGHPRRAGRSALPTLLAMHHPPLVTGIPTMDTIGIADGERRALADVLARTRPSCVSELADARSSDTTRPLAWPAAILRSAYSRPGRSSAR
jgi:hypothetical protein